MTERRLAASRRLDRLSIADAFDVLNAEDRKIAAAVAAARPAIVRAVKRVVRAWRAGGRLIYVGAGTSGRLGVLDAAECPPTFRSPPGMVRGIIAGGRAALVRAVEGAEDDERAAAAAMRRTRVGPADVVFGVATGGTTPYVHAALREARRRGAKTVFLACVSRRHVRADVDVDIRVLTGPEALTGSTRLKAGLATKMVLNAVSTLGMVRLGKVYENLMVDLNSYACRKLTDRATRVLAMLTGLSYADAGALLRRARGKVKAALVMHRRGVTLPQAERILSRAAGHVRWALEK
jgi:N-acetylmuramic acid 6-phosphate etherase